MFRLFLMCCMKNETQWRRYNIWGIGMTNELMMAGYAVYQDLAESTTEKNVYLLVKQDTATILEISFDFTIKKVDEHYIARARVEAELGIGTLKIVEFDLRLARQILRLMTANKCV